MEYLAQISQIQLDRILIDFLDSNWLTLVFIYGVLRAMFPYSKFLKSIGDTVLNFRDRRKAVTSPSPEKENKEKSA